MALEFSYSFDTANSALDMVRSLIGDTDEATAMMGDREILGYLAAAGQNTYRAAARCARALAGKFARQVDVKSDDIAKSQSQISKGFSDLANQLDQQAALMGVTPYIGGISKADKRSREQDRDRVQPSFTRQTDVPRQGSIGISTSDPRHFLDGQE